MKTSKVLAIGERHALGSILGLGFLIRLVAIGSRGMTYDDTFSIFLSERSLPEIVRGTAADTMPPLYYFLLHFWIQIGSIFGRVHQAWFFRLPSVFLSLLAVYLLYRLVNLLFEDRRAGLLAAFLAAISPFQFYHAQDVRNYALLLCAEIGCLYFTARLLKTEGKKWQDWVGVGGCALAAMYTHNAAIFALVLPDIWLFFQKRWKILGKLLLVQGGVGLLTLPWLLELPTQLEKIQRAWWLWKPGWIDLIQIPIVWSAGLPLGGPWLAFGLLLGLEICAMMLIQLSKIRKGAEIGLLVLVMLALPSLLALASYAFRPVFVPRVFILSSMAFFGLAARLISLNWKVAGGRLLLGSFIVAGLVGLPSQASFSDFPRAPFEKAAGLLSLEIKDGDRIVHDNKMSYFPFLFYQPALPSAFVGDEPGSSNDTFAFGSQDAMKIFPVSDLPEAVGDSNGVFFVVFSAAIQNYKDAGFIDHPGLSWLGQHFHLVDRQIYNDLEVYHYTRP